MKISLDELKKAVSWIESNSRDVNVTLFVDDGNKLVLKCMDKYESEVEISLYENSQMMPKIKKTEVLRWPK